MGFIVGDRSYTNLYKNASEKKPFPRRLCILAVTGLSFIIVLAICLIIFLPVGPNDNVLKKDLTASDLRLPKTIRPNDYSLLIKVHLPGYDYDPGNKTNQFDGNVEINVSVLEPTDVIRIHSFDLNIKSIALKNVKGTTFSVARHKLNTDLQMLLIHLDETLEVQNYLLEISFNGTIRKDLSGLYESNYKENGVTRTIAITQFESSSARKMVPCFDEPGMKANWSVTVVHPKGTVALSNGIELSTEAYSEKDLLVTTFKTTPKMSSYLLAICVADFVKREGRTKNGVLFRIWAKRSMHSNTEYALEAGIKATDYYEEYFDIPFPLEKQDMIAIPDFEMGAMENWGMVTYREVDLLYDPAITLPETKKRVALVIAHELAHQWFGNLVTMEWWDDLWLNEGFANYVEHLGTDVISDGAFKMEDTFVSSTQAGVLKVDAGTTSHPLSFSIEKVDEVSGAFDLITYSKGGSILRMLKYVLGEENFKKGIRFYLKKHAYGNAKVDDLFDALNKTSSDSQLGPDGQRLDVVDFANQWTHQMGFPLLTVTRHNSSHVQIIQSRYKNDPNQVDNPKYSHPKYGFKWDVPIWYQEGSGKQEKFVWLTREGPIYVEAEDTIVLNTDSRAFFRVNYEKEILKSIADELNEDVYSGRTKYRLLNDAFLMAEKEEIDYQLLLKLVTFVQKEKTRLPWLGAIDGLKSIKNLYGSDPEGLPISDFIRKLIKKSGLDLRWSEINRDYLDDQKYEEVQLKMLLKAYDDGMTQELLDSFNTNVLESCNSTQATTECSLGIPAPMRYEVFCTAVRRLDELAFDRVVEFLRVGVQPAEQTMLQTALSCASEPVLLKRSLLLALDPTGPIRLQNSFLSFVMISRHDAGREIMLHFLFTRYNEIKEQLSANTSMLLRVLTFLTSNIVDQASLQSLQQFIKVNPETENMLGSAVENAKIKIQWRAKYFKQVSGIFKDAVNRL